MHLASKKNCSCFGVCQEPGPSAAQSLPSELSAGLHDGTGGVSLFLVQVSLRDGVRPVAGFAPMNLSCVRAASLQFHLSLCDVLVVALMHSLLRWSDVLCTSAGRACISGVSVLPLRLSGCGCVCFCLCLI